MERGQRWVSHHDRCVYKVVDGDGIFYSMVLNVNGVWLDVDDTKWSCAA